MRSQLKTAAACLLLLLCSSSATVATQRRENLLERRKLLRPEQGAALNRLHESLLPVGEASNRISGAR